MSRNSRLKGQIETFQKPFQKKVYESPFRPQQHSHNRSRHPPKRLKIRSIAGSTYEIDDNEVHEIIHEPMPEVHNEAPIYIKPMFRVTTKKDVFDSIIDILHQLLGPPKNQLGPIVGPIQMPGSKRKIYLRLVEPVDASHINVRFVTQVPVPVVDEDSWESGSLLPFLPFANPANTLLHRPVGSSDATFSSSNHHHSIQLPRNASHISGKGRKLQSKTTTKPKSPSQDLKDTDKENLSPVKVEAASGAEGDKNHLYQSGDDAIKQVIFKDTTKNEQDSKDSLESWYQLSTHHLPLRQIAPLYPLSVMEHTDSSSNTYNVSSDLTVPSPHSNSYEQYSNSYSNAGTVNVAPGYYDQSYTIPNTYSTTYQKQNEFSNAPSSYSISYQSQNEFNNAPSSTSYVKQNNLFNTPTTYMSSYMKPTNVPPPSNSYAASHETQSGVQTGSSSQNALHVIDPPSYFLDSRKVLDNHANKVFEPTAIPQQYYNLPNVNEIGTLPHYAAQNGMSSIDQVTWGKVKREKSESNFQKNESNFQKSAKITSDNNREKWQPFVPEGMDWHKAFANLAKIANGERHETVARQQSTVSQSTTLSTIEIRKVDQRQSGKRRPVATTRSSRCTTLDKGYKCERTESIVSTPHPEGTIKISEEQIQSIANIEPIAVITPKSAKNTTETSRLNVITKSSLEQIEEPQLLVMTTESLTTNNTTERPSLLIKVIKNTTKKLIENKTTSESVMSNLTEKSTATERLPISDTSKASISNSTTKSLQLPKRPMIMKKPTFVLKKIEPSSTTRRTVANSIMRKSMSNTTEKTNTTRRSKIRGVVLKTKSTTT